VTSNGTLDCLTFNGCAVRPDPANAAYRHVQRLRGQAGPR
jgi:hypothetical protein